MLNVLQSSQLSMANMKDKPCNIIIYPVGLTTDYVTKANIAITEYILTICLNKNLRLITLAMAFSFTFVTGI